MKSSIDLSMPLPGFSVRLQHGIQGGFAPPTPDAIHNLDYAGEIGAASATGDDHPVISVTSSVRQHGTPDLPDAVPKNLVVPAESVEEKAIHELRDIIKELPREDPPGSEDIYGLDTSIAWFSDDFMWVNGGPQGCGFDPSTVKASDEHKEKFKRAVAIVSELVNKAK